MLEAVIDKVLVEVESFRGTDIPISLFFDLYKQVGNQSHNHRYTQVDSIRSDPIRSDPIAHNVHTCKDPWLDDSSTSNQQRIDTTRALHALRLIPGIHIAIANDRNIRCLGALCNVIPIGSTRVALFLRAAVDLSAIAKRVNIHLESRAEIES
jgi:hypothetical protein